MAAEATQVAEVLSAYVEHSPFCARLGMRADAVEHDRLQAWLTART